MGEREVGSSESMYATTHRGIEGDREGMGGAWGKQKREKEREIGRP